MPNLRLIVACERCARQYDASRRTVGSRFRCACGEVLTVPRPSSHEAAVVRCSSCGAPRQGQKNACSFCGADFTLHERDLDTICPHCMARISGRARFCHACATPVLVAAAAGSPTDHPCPACGDGKKLASRRLGEQAIAALECGTCGGLWIGNETFRLLAERARTEALSPREHGAPSQAESAPPPQQGSFYRNCPRCGRLMHRQNYGRRSGVILDVCKEDGVWFDAQELERVLAWVRRGGHELEAELRAEEQREAARREWQRRFREQEMDLQHPSRQKADLLTTLVDWVGGAVESIFVR